MAWAKGGANDFVSAFNETSANSIVGTYAPLGSNAVAGDVLLVFIACNNVGTGDGDLAEIASVTDSKGNTYTKIKEWTNGQGAAAGGATVGAYYSKLTTTLVANVDTVTANFANTITAKVLGGWRYTIGAGNTVSIAGTVQTEVIDNGDATILTITGLPNREYLFVRVIASETDAFGISTFSTFFADTYSGASGTSGNEKGHMSLQTEYQIVTATDLGSEPILTDTTVDLASIYFALKEAASATPLTVTVADNLAV